MPNAFHPEDRLIALNSGKSVYTKGFKPWELVWHCNFKEKFKALEFEKYLNHIPEEFLFKKDYG